MIKNPLLRDVVAILIPEPDEPPVEADPEFHEQYRNNMEVLEDVREDLAERLSIESDGTMADPLMIALEEARSEIRARERKLRQLLAYGREFVPGRGYSLESLARAADMSTSGVRTAYKEADIEAVRELIRSAGRVAPTKSPEEEVLDHLTGLLDRVDQATRTDMLADDGAKLRPLLASLNDEAAERVMNKVREGYAVLIPRRKTEPTEDTDAPRQEQA